MNVVRYEPWTAMRRFQDDINRLFQDGRLDVERGGAIDSAWVPAADVREETDRYVILADVPGVEPESIEITMDNGVLTIKGERRDEAAEERNGYRRVERVHGAFQRRFSLPDSANPDAVSATGRNGVLEVVIAKHEKLQPRRIQVN